MRGSRVYLSKLSNLRRRRRLPVAADVCSRNGQTPMAATQLQSHQQLSSETISGHVGRFISSSNCLRCCTDGRRCQFGSNGRKSGRWQKRTTTDFVLHEEPSSSLRGPQVAASFSRIHRTGHATEKGHEEHVEGSGGFWFNRIWRRHQIRGEKREMVVEDDIPSGRHHRFRHRSSGRRIPHPNEICRNDESRGLWTDIGRHIWRHVRRFGPLVRQRFHLGWLRSPQND